MSDLRQNSTSPVSREDTLRIGLIADTHEAEDPSALLAALSRANCDINIHLGDVAGSRERTRLIREYKRALGSVASLNAAQHELYERLVSSGARPMSAFADALLGNSSAARDQRRLEIQEAYEEVIASLLSLPRSYCLLGNVDRALVNAGLLRDVPLEPDIVVRQPTWIDAGSDVLILWPSVPRARAQPSGTAVCRSTWRQWPRFGESKRRVIILAHEQLFKGPSPTVYRSRVQHSGQEAINVPWFEPHNDAAEILAFLRSLPPRVESWFVFGHMHDSAAAIEAGLPYLRDRSGEGWHYRLNGLGSVERSVDGALAGRRSVRLAYVPLNAVATMTLADHEIAWEVQQW